MEHVNKAGESKVKPQCELPLAGRRVVARLITDLAVFDFPGDGSMVLVELLAGADVEQVRASTEAPVEIAAGSTP
jgi:3-oxoacid CoA-transferase subunit B